MLVCCQQGWVEELSWVQTVLLHRVIFPPQLFASSVPRVKFEAPFLTLPVLSLLFALTLK